MKSSPLNWTCYCLRRRCIGVEKSIANHCKTTNAYYWLGLIWAAIRCTTGFATCSDSLIFACACLLSSYTFVSKYTQLLKIYFWCSEALGIGPSVVFHIRHTEMFCFYCLYCEVVLFVCMLCAIVILFFIAVIICIYGLLHDRWNEKERVHGCAVSDWQGLNLLQRSRGPSVDRRVCGVCSRWSWEFGISMTKFPILVCITILVLSLHSNSFLRLTRRAGYQITNFHSTIVNTWVLAMSADPNMGKRHCCESLHLEKKDSGLQKLERKYTNNDKMSYDVQQRFS